MRIARSSPKMMLAPRASITRRRLARVRVCSTSGYCASVDSYESLSRRIRLFAEERDWERFHTPKNLAMALAGEVGELLAELQWLQDEDVREQLGGALRNRVEQEVGDIFIYLVRFADQTGIDLLAAANLKIDGNATRYPVETSRGSAEKYDRLPSVAPPTTGGATSE